MSWFNRRPRLEETLQRALAEALASVYSGQAALLEQQTRFLGTMGELTTRRAAQALGMRGGLRSAERRAQKRAARRATGCGLCDDPNRLDVSVEMIAIHRSHGTPTPPPQRNGNGPASSHSPPGDAGSED